MSEASRTPEVDALIRDVNPKSRNADYWILKHQRAVDLARSLETQRDAALERERGLREALLYWLPDETWMEDRFPRGDSVAKKHWEMFYKHSALAAKGEK